VTPAEGPAEGGTEITITGANFDGATAVRVGGVPATGLVRVGPTAVRATVAAGEPGPVAVSVTTPSGTASLANAFTYLVSLNGPSVNSVTPNRGPTAGGTAITITGSGFSSGAQVTVGGAPCGSVAVVSPSTVTCTTPAGTEGPAVVVVTNADTQSATRPGAFTFETPPAPAPTAGAQAVPASAARTTRIRAPRADGRVVRVTIAAGGAGTATLRVADGCRASRKVTRAGTVELSCRIRPGVTSVRVTAAFTPVVGAVVTRTAVVRIAR